MGQRPQQLNGRDREDDSAVCPACGLPRPARSRAERRHYRCSRCKSLVTWDWPSESGLAALYADAWGQQDGASFATGATRPELAFQLVQLARTSVRGIRCLDFGAGRGELARELARQGADCVAVEPFGPNPRVPGVRWLDSLSKATQLAPYELLYAIEVIEHHPDPVQCLRELALQMADGSLLVVTTPNALGLNSRLRGSRWREAQNRTHLCLFSPEGLQNCAERAGLVVKYRATTPVHFGSQGPRRWLQRILQSLRLDGSLRLVFGLSESVAGRHSERSM